MSDRFVYPLWMQKTTNFFSRSKVYKNRANETVPVPKIIIHPPKRMQSQTSREHNFIESPESKKSKFFSKLSKLYLISII